MQRWSDLLDLVRADMRRYTDARGLRAFADTLLRKRGFLASSAWRLARHYHRRGRVPGAVRALHRGVFVLTRCEIPYAATIGPGLRIDHADGVVIHADVRAGRNLTLGHQVTLGQKPSGPHAGVPTLGDDVYVAPGAKVIGAVTIGDRSAIGANAVVTRSVPDDHVAVGVPARSAPGGSAAYVARTGGPCDVPAERW